VKTDLAEARRVLARVENLKKTDFSSEASLTEARALVERLTAGLASARAEAEVADYAVQGAREQLALHTIRAPFAGVVTEKTAQPGEVVSPMSAGGGFTRTGVCTIVDMSSLEIEVDVNESFIGRVSAGQRVTATLDAYPEWDIPARVIAIIPSANREKATVRVRIGLDTDDARILPDMGVKVAFKKA
jgi:multidrug resistance efflux pump